MTQYPSSKDPRWQSDLTAFIAVLAIGGALIVVGHLTPTALTTVSTALATLYAAWKVRHSER